MANTENTVAVKTSTTTTTSSSTESKIAKKSKKKRKQSSKKQKGKQPDSDAKVEAVQEAEEPRAVLEPPPKTKSNKKKRKKDRRVKTGAGADADGAQTKAYQEAISERQPKKQKLDHVKETDVKSRDQESASLFPFPTDPDDHCESPLQAYAHVEPFLSLLGTLLGKGDNKELRLYDPYYCNGSVKNHLNRIGYPTVYNEKEDCYKVWASDSSYPDFDVLITNPPYSGDHIEELIQHVTSPRMTITTSSSHGKNRQKSTSPATTTTKPWLLLMPEWVHKKEYFIDAMRTSQIQPFYLVPHKRYIYLPPKDYRQAKKSDVHKKSSPFPSMWYIWGGSHEWNDKLMQQYHSHNNKCLVVEEDDTSTSDSQQRRVALSSVCDLARSKSALRDLRRKHKKR